MNKQAVLNDLKAILSCVVHQDKNLSAYGTWQIGGPADILVSPATIDDVQKIQRYVHQHKLPSIVIGDGSNILFDDAGFRGVVIHIGRNLSAVKFGADGVVTSQAGTWIPRFVSTVCRKGLQGCEHAIGVPGTLGGLVVMNGGTNRKGIGEQLVNVSFVNETGDIEQYNHNQCGFLYRTSVFQNMNAIVVEATFKYAQGDVKTLRQQMIKTLMERNRKFPRKMPNCGSVFLSDPALYETVGPPGKAIEEAGLKGLSVGGAMISPMHANFIVNKGNAKAADVLSIIKTIRDAVYKNTGHRMNCEVKHLLPNGRMVPAHESAESERYSSCA